ncbi:MAG: hypothetical protein JEZ14_06990 [Marinilabiliaceae bacterium]|nr:hypothetical protein [Marinilabiliaceae bacterium]
MEIKQQLFGLMAALGRKVYRIAGYHYLAEENEVLARQFSLGIKDQECLLTRQQLKAYQQRWKVLGKDIRNIHVNNAYCFRGVFDIDIVPSNIYYSAIEPALNNRTFGISYEDKARIDWINGETNVPHIFVRNINGVYYDASQKEVFRSNIDLNDLVKNKKAVVVKKTIESHGGKGVIIFDRDMEGILRNAEGDILTLDYLEKLYEQDFLIQEFVEQHPFYNQFNPSSLNTFRVVTYRSVLDNKIHVLYTFLRVGAPGSRIDNVSKGGLFLCLKEDGCFVDFGLRKGGEKVFKLDGFPPFAEMDRVYMIDEVWQLAKEIAARHVYSRLLAFDMTVDKNGKILHIETNTSDIGMEGIQYTIGPIFRRFTNEVINYCQEKLKKVSLYKLHAS